ncbi:RBBP9/YdeN family alpha/beta hydrolase [Beijerinckia indica]|uniref:Alpha/beta hydrolase n=1 Tax=Beijerinckia indica subsp. indica (strain ATCC 9039 / DSM 1715 / NCIMB 8712) TaxID=395963 RepID=B2IJD9_BEII9|nr:alpha/beta hydrolase [Beijerinckia indica]ACB96252.1 protein of unknown function DUF1234 [Beijerinckia indica subsp. indica ATCC 9039]
MRTSEAEILIVPGLGGSGDDHWQSRWNEKLPTARRVLQDDWLNPSREAWTARIAADVARAELPVIFIAHSLGVLAVVHAAPLIDASKVKGAFLVAPPSAAAIRDIAAIDSAFAHEIETPLPFPSLVIASRNDSYATFEDSEALAMKLGATLADAGQSGHINIESGHGPWPEGLMRFAGFLKGL